MILFSPDIIYYFYKCYTLWHLVDFSAFKQWNWQHSGKSNASRQDSNMQSNLGKFHLSFGHEDEVSRYRIWKVPNKDMHCLKMGNWALFRSISGDWTVKHTWLKCGIPRIKGTYVRFLMRDILSLILDYSGRYIIFSLSIKTKMSTQTRVHTRYRGYSGYL